MMRSSYSRLAAVAASVVVVAASATGAYGDDANGTPPLTLAVTSFGPPVVAEGTFITAAVEITNTTAVSVARARVHLAVTAEPLRTPTALTDFLADPSASELRTISERGIGSVVDDVPTPRLVGGATQMLNLTAPATAQVFGHDWGVYGVAWGIERAGTVQWVDATAITWEGLGIPTMPVSFVASVTDTGSRAGALLVGADHPAVALVIDTASLGDGLTARPSLVDREIYRLPYGSPDVTSLAHAGNDFLMTFALARSDAVAPRSVRGSPWIATPAVLDAQTLAFSARHGAVASMWVPRFGAEVPERIEPAIGTPVVNVTTDNGVVPVIVPHPELSALVTQYRPQHPATPSRIVAEAALVASTNPVGNPIVIAPGPSWVVSGESVSPVVTALLDAPFIEPQPLSATLSYPTRDSATVEDRAMAEDSIDPATLGTLARRLERLQSLASATDDPFATSAPYIYALTRAIDSWGRGDTEARDQAISDVADSLAEANQLVRISSSSLVNLVSTSGNLPVTIRNDLDVAVTVTVVVTSRSPILVVEDAPVVTIAPQSEATATVPVTAVSSGNVSVSLSLRNDDGTTISEYHTTTMRVRAEWGNAITAVATVALIALLIAGVVRTVRRGRAETRLGPQLGEDASD